MIGKPTAALADLARPAVIKANPEAFQQLTTFESIVHSSGNIQGTFWLIVLNNYCVSQRG